MSCVAHLRRIVRALVVAAAAAGGLPACGGSDAADPAPRPQALAAPALEGARVSGREQALQIVARGVVAPLYFSEAAHAVLARVFELRSAGPAASAGDRWVVAPDAQPLGQGAAVEGPIGVEIEAAENAEGLLLRAEAGHVRAVLHFERTALGAARVDGSVLLDVSRSAADAGSQRRSRAETLAITDGHGTRHASYLDVQIDADNVVQHLSVVSDVPLDGAGRVWIDVTSSVPGRLDAAAPGTRLTSGSCVATGVIGSLYARLTLQVAADGAWTIEVDNAKDAHIDFVVQALASEAQVLASGR